jgi:hypothetical protein
MLTRSESGLWLSLGFEINKDIDCGSSKNFNLLAIISTILINNLHQIKKIFMLYLVENY